MDIVISIAWVSRNDNHGGHLIERIQVAIDALDYYIRTEKLRIELLFVEWNPPPSTPALRQVVNTKSIPTRWYIVPPEIHNSFPLSERMPIFQHIGCNIGLRQAKGSWFLTTTHDCIFSQQLARSLSGFLDTRYFYRAIRRDCDIQLSEKWDTPTRIAYMDQHIIRERTWKAGLFTGASGDFILAPRAKWNILRGYPEWAMSGQFLDGLTLYRLLGTGLQQYVFPDPNYHMEHGQRATELSGSLPRIPWSSYKKLGEVMRDKLNPGEINGDEWGLGTNKDEQIEDNAWKIIGPYSYQKKVNWDDLRKILTKRG